jgi:ubiquinone biosynthesis protein Coq4/catechol 2,3-dioxygenase-like lactoylglutathione lyase family enzyme
MTDAPRPWNDSLRRADLADRHRWREARVAFDAARRVARDPANTAHVFELLENFPVLDWMRWRMGRLPFLRDPRFLALYERRALPDLGPAAVERLAALPDGTLGREYARFVQSRGYTDVFLTWMTPDAPDRYFARRTGLLHDLVHFVLGYEPVEWIGEIEVEVFLLAQSRAPNHLLFLLGWLGIAARRGPRGLWRGRRRLRDAWRLGQRAPSLFLFEWERHWERPLAEVRRELNIDARPACGPLREPTAKPALAHLVLNVPDRVAAERFYIERFGYTVSGRDDRLGATFLTDGTDHHTLALQECLPRNPLRLPFAIARQLRRGAALLAMRRRAARAGTRRYTLPPARIVRAGLWSGHNHTGYRVPDEAELRAWYGRLRRAGVAIEWAVNHDDMVMGFYFRDPGGNWIELFCDGAKAHALRAEVEAAGSLEAAGHAPADVHNWELDLERAWPSA